MSFNKELAVSHIGAAEQSLAYLQLEINNPSYNEHNALWHIKRARLCIDKVERILSDKQSSSEPEPPLQQAAVSRSATDTQSIPDGKTNDFMQFLKEDSY